MRIVLAGAGFTALEAAPMLKRNLPSANITLISRNKQRQLHFPSELINGHAEHFDVEQHCQKTGVECIIGEITSINRKEKYVHVGEALVHYDYLLLDLGSEPDTKSLPGLEHSFPLKASTDAHHLRHHIISQFIHAKVDYEPVHRTFVIAGEELRAIEAAAEVRALIDQLCERHLFFPSEMDVVLLTQGEAVPKEIAEAFEKQGIEVYRSAIHKYTGAGIYLADRIIETHTLIWTHSVPNKIIETLSLQLGLEGAAVVNQYLQTSDPCIFAAGGCATRTRQLPLTSLHRADASIISHNIVAAIQHEPLKVLSTTNKPYTIASGHEKALLVTRYWHWYGSTPYRIRNYFLNLHRERIQKA